MFVCYTIRFSACCFAESVSITFGASNKLKYFKRKKSNFSSFFLSTVSLYFILASNTNGTTKKKLNKNKTTNPDFEYNRSNNKKIRYRCGVYVIHQTILLYLFHSIHHTHTHPLFSMCSICSLFISFRTNE